MIETFQKEGIYMKAINKYVHMCIAFIGMLLLLSACGSNAETSKTYSYDDLSEEYKNVVDGVLNEYDSWKSFSDSGKNWGCTNVTFIWDGEQLLFVTCYRTSSAEKIGDGVSSLGTSFYKVYEVDTQSGELSGHEYSLGENVEKNSHCIQALNGHEFASGFSELEKKDALADELMRNKNK